MIVNFKLLIAMLVLTTLPAQYDARNAGYESKLKDQGNTNLCWAYSAMNASEASILKDGLADNVSLNPTSIAYHRYNREEDLLGNFKGEQSDADFLQAFGNVGIVASLLSEWYGPVEENISYKANPLYNSKFKLTDTLEISNSSYTKEEKINAIKQAILDYGAVTFSYYNARETYYYNPKNETSTNGVAHACTLIGWDDNIASSSFFPGGASQNGGWLVKNSYSSLPYFYLSYDSDSSQAYAFKYKKSDDFDYNYFYDNSLDDSISSLYAVRNAANIFEVKKSNQILKAVNIGLSGFNTNCKIKIYTNISDTSNPTNGTLVYEKEQILDLPGYRTIYIDEPVKLTLGTYYSVIVEVNGNSFIRIGQNVSPLSFRYSSYWNKVSNYTPRIKAFTCEDNNQEKESLDNATIEVNDYIYTGKEIKPEIIVKLNDKQITDYEVTYANNINAGTAKGMITSSHYEGKKEFTFNISHKSIDSDDINYSLNNNEFIYDKTAKEPIVELSYNSLKLIENNDYSISYHDNINAGSAYVLIKGINNFSGERKIYYQINKAILENVITSINVSKDITYLKEITLNDNYAWVNGNLKVDNLNKAKIRYIAEDKDNYVQTEFDVILIHEKNTEIDDDSPLTPEHKNKNKNMIKIVIGISFGAAILIIGFLSYLKYKKKKGLK